MLNKCPDGSGWDRVALCYMLTRYLVICGLTRVRILPVLDSLLASHVKEAFLRLTESDKLGFPLSGWFRDYHWYQGQGLFQPYPWRCNPESWAAPLRHMSAVKICRVLKLIVDQSGNDNNNRMHVIFTGVYGCG